MITLALDISSTSTGWSVIKSGRFYKRPDLDYGLIQPGKKFTPGQKKVFFRDNLEEVFKKVKPGIVGIEDTFLRNTKTLKVLSRYCGIAWELAYRYTQEDPIIVSVTSIRAVIGTQDKKEIFNLMVDKYKLQDWEFSKHNDITDSLAVGLYTDKYIRGKV
jgi:Holliday junction resolvasome RuvABC endonuclease subunit